MFGCLTWLQEGSFYVTSVAQIIFSYVASYSLKGQEGRRKRQAQGMI